MDATTSRHLPVTQTCGENSLRHRLLEYFKANPDEYLTPKDVAIKFGVREQHARQAAFRMRELGELGDGPDLSLPKK